MDIRIEQAPDGASVITFKHNGTRGLRIERVEQLVADEVPGQSFPAAPKGLQVNVNEGTVTDHRTGLMWSAADVVPSCTDQAKAAQACKDLRLGGFNDWRLPTRAELLTLVDDTRHKPAIDIKAFPTCKSDWYWTSTPCAWSSDYAWFVSFGYGAASYDLRGYGSALARAVRSVPAGQ